MKIEDDISMCLAPRRLSSDPFPASSHSPHNFPLCGQSSHLHKRVISKQRWHNPWLACVWIPCYTLYLNVSRGCALKFYLNDLSSFKSWKMMLWKCCTQYASKCGKLSSGFRTGKVSFHSSPKERQCQRMFKLMHNCTHLTRSQSNAQKSPG